MSVRAGAHTAVEHAAFVELYERGIDEVYGFLLLRVGGDRSLAEDLTSEVFAAAVAEFNRSGGATVGVGWLITVARRRLIDHWRRRSVAERGAIVLASEPAHVEAPDIAEQRLVQLALGRLPELQRAVLVLQQVDGYSVRQIAEHLDRTPKSVESLLTRARTSFRTAYREVADD